MINELTDSGWLAMHLAIVVLPIVNVMISRLWNRSEKIGWAFSILFFNLLAYLVFLFVTANRLNRRELDEVGTPARAGEGSAGTASAGRPSIVFVIGNRISSLGRKAAIGIAIGLVVWVLSHLGNSEWMRESYWPWYLLVLFLYWLPVEFVGQILMALGRKRPSSQKAP